MYIMYVMLVKALNLNFCVADSQVSAQLNFYILINCKVFFKLPMALQCIPKDIIYQKRLIASIPTINSIILYVLRIHCGFKLSLNFLRYHCAACMPIEQGRCLSIDNDKAMDAYMHVCADQYMYISIVIQFCIYKLISRQCS